jgi:hypothetical protein
MKAVLPKSSVVSGLAPRANSKSMAGRLQVAAARINAVKPPDPRQLGFSFSEDE